MGNTLKNPMMRLKSLNFHAYSSTTLVFAFTGVANALKKKNGPKKGNLNRRVCTRFSRKRVGGYFHRLASNARYWGEHRNRTKRGNNQFTAMPEPEINIFL